MSETLRIVCWARLALLQPRESGYYAVRDYECREGVAFMHPNKTWTPISGRAERPYADWSEIE